MSRKRHDASRKYHDRVARQYDAMYDDAFWEFHDKITWHHLKPFVPKNTASPVLDLGCGTGKWGLKLLKMGHPTTFTDHSPGMLDVVREKLAVWAAQPDLAAKAAKAVVQQADAVDLSAFPGDCFDLVTAMGDVVSICSDPAKCLAQVNALLRPGGAFVFTVDNRLAALDHFAATGNLDALAQFVHTGATQWLTRDEAEQFDVHMFLPAEIEALARARGFEVISRIGKTVLPVRRNTKFFEKDGSVEKLIELELSLAREPAAVGRASHLQLAVRKP